MNYPLVSVIIPAFNQAEYLGAAISSVLNQTYPHFELIIVNDASPDHTEQIVRGFDDPRIVYLVHERNRGLPATRNTGMRAARGDFIALLDADDLFHPHKLASHVTFLLDKPSVGVSYNARFNTDACGNVLDIWRPATAVALRDLVLGFPYAPSDMVIRRHWAFRVDLFDETFVHFSEDLDINCRLALAGCRFAGTDRALNYRRFYAGRVIANVEARASAAFRALERAFADPVCPQEIRALRKLALGRWSLLWGIEALISEDTALGKRLLLEAIRHYPAIVMDLNWLSETILSTCIRGGTPHETVLGRVFSNLPAPLSAATARHPWAVSRGHLLKRVQETIWDRMDEGHIHFARAGDLGATADEPFLRWLAQKVIDYQNEFGDAAAEDVLRRLSSHLGDFASPAAARFFEGCYFANRAFATFAARQYRAVPRSVGRAILNDHNYVLNRGIWSVLARSVAAIARE